VASAGPSTQLPNNIPPWVAQAQLLGPSDGNKQVAVAIYLQLNNLTELQSFLHDLYTPGTPTYGHFLTPDEFRATYSPSASATAAVQNFLSQGGLKVTYTPANGMYVEATGSVAQVAKVFAVSQNDYQYNGMVLRSNAEPPTIPASLTSIVTFIEGLDDSHMLIQSNAHLRRNLQPSAPPPIAFYTPPPCSTFWGDHSATVNPPAYQYGATFPWANCGYTPQQMQAAYGVNSVPWTGTGVRVGVTDAFASPTIVDDVNRFSAHYGLPPLTSSNFQQIVVPGTYNYPQNLQNPSGWYLEETLDIEWVHSMAPGATIIFAGAQNTGNNSAHGSQTLPHALIHLIDNHLTDIITNSWEYNTDLKQYGLVEPMEAAFMQAAAEGISILFASGDFGDDLLLGLTIAQAGWPDDSPFVTAVGGTTLAIYDAEGDKDEWGWGTYGSGLVNSSVSPDGTVVTGTSWSPWPPQPFLYSGSTGGVSLTFAQPDYQQGIVPKSLATSTVDVNGNVVTLSSPYRVVPDIAMEADFENSGAIVGATFTISSDPLANLGCTPLGNSTEYCEYPTGGTSLASPMFAGVLALTNQARFAAGRGPVGFVNPALYRLPVGRLGSKAPIYDVVAPKTPVGTIFNMEISPGVLQTQFFSINSFPVGTSGPVIEGADTSLRTTPGYDNVTGLGTPNVPAFVAAFVSLP